MTTTHLRCKNTQILVDETPEQNGLELKSNMTTVFRTFRTETTNIVNKTVRYYRKGYGTFGVKIIVMYVIKNNTTIARIRYNTEVKVDQFEIFSNLYIYSRKYFQRFSVCDLTEQFCF